MQANLLRKTLKQCSILLNIKIKYKNNAIICTDTVSLGFYLALTPVLVCMRGPANKSEVANLKYFDFAKFDLNSQLAS